MASTPSAPALSAVLRCRGNIWARNPPTKRPSSSAYSLGLAGSVVRDSPVERSRTQQASPWESFLRGERVLVVGRGLTVACEFPRVIHGDVQRGKDSKDVNKSHLPKVSQSTGDARSAVSALQNALLRQLTPNLPGIDKTSKIIQMIKHEAKAADICKIIFIQAARDFPAGVLKVSIRPPCLMKKGQIPSLLFSGCSTLKDKCLSLTALVSHFVFVKLICGSSCNPDDALQLLLRQQEEENNRHEALQERGQKLNPSDLSATEDKPSSESMITEDRPD